MIILVHTSNIIVVNSYLFMILLAASMKNPLRLPDVLRSPVTVFGPDCVRDRIYTA